MSVIEVFPRRPLQLTGFCHRLSYWSLILLTIGIAALAFEVYSATPALWDDYRLRAAGTVARHSHLENGVCHIRILTDCDLDAQYVTHDGSSHTRHVELLTVYQEPDQDSVFMVRYDPASPEHISTTWGARLLLNRTLTLILTVLFLLAAIAGMAWLLIYPGRLRRKLAAIGAQPTPVEVKLGRVAAGSGSANIFYSWTDSTGRSLTASTEFQGTREPFWLDAAKTKMLALTAPDGQAQLLDAALASVSLTSQERARVIEARDRALRPGVASTTNLRARA